MLIKILVENTSLSENFSGTHGLSLYIETANHKILFDLGPNNNLFLENADKMKVDIAEVDTVIISHGHFDHGGALKTFLENNTKAKIYLKESAFDDYYLKKLFLKFRIGLDSSLKDSDRLIFTTDYLQIDKELQLFSGITDNQFFSKQNKVLMRKMGKKLVKDDFEHEQSLLICENDSYTLIGGCAHKGIVNILEKAETMTGSVINTVISGFHFLRMKMNDDNKKYLREFAQELLKRQTVYYTCHCTGQEPYQVLKEVMGEQIQYVSTGCELRFNLTENELDNPETQEPHVMDCYNSEFNTNYYRSDVKAVIIKWKKFCSGSNYREPLYHALELLKKYQSTKVVIDTRNGFEDEKEDLKWALEEYIPLMAATDCKQIIILATAGNIEGELDIFTKEFMKYFEVVKCSSEEELIELLV